MREWFGLTPRMQGAIAFYLGAGFAAEFGLGLIMAYGIGSCGAYLTYLEMRKAMAR